jgi:hypothetical protein
MQPVLNTTNLTDWLLLHHLATNSNLADAFSVNRKSVLQHAACG